MTTKDTLLSLAAGLLVSTAAFAQMPPMPKPGPEQAILAQDAGTWDAVVEMAMPGAPAMTSKGTEVATMGCGGMCLITDFSGEMMGAPFKGHGLTAYDATKKKYVGSWSDSMSSGVQTSEATYDAATKSTTGWMEGTDPSSGASVKTKSVSTSVDADHRTMTMFMAGPDGKDVQTMKISYTRRK